MKELTGSIKRLLPLKPAILAIIFGLIKLLTVYLGIRVYLPGSIGSTDPGEIFNLIGAAITGPAGGIIISIISIIKVSQPDFRIYIFITHLVSIVFIGIAYKKLLYERYDMPLFSIVWLALILIYYFLSVEVMNSLYYFFYPSLYYKLAGANISLLQSMLNNFLNYLPEIFLTAVITTLILIALPDKYRKPLWGPSSSSPAANKKYNLYKRNFLSVRLTIWFLILFSITLIYLSILVRNYYSDFILNNEGKQRYEIVKNISDILNYTPENSFLKTIMEIQNKNSNSLAILDKNFNPVPDHNTPGMAKASSINSWNINTANISQKENGYYIDKKLLTAVGYIHLKNGLYLLSAVTNDGSNRETSQLVFYLVRDTGFALLITAIIAGFIIWLIVGNPLNKITEVANEIGKHNYDIKIKDSEMFDEIGILAYSINIMKDNVKIAEEMLSNILNSIPQSIFWKNKNSVYLGCNDNFARAVGLKLSSQIIGKTDFELPWKTDETKAYIADDKVVINSGRPIFHIVESLTDINGIQLWVDTTKIPLYTADGTIYGVLGIYENITERKHAEEALRISEERYRQLYENSPLGIYRTTPNGQILLANRALIKMLGYFSFEEIAKRNLEKNGFESPYEREQFINQIETNGEVIGLESAWKCNDGSIVYVRENARVIRDSDGKTLYYDGIVENITERKLSELQLRESESRYRELFEAESDAILLIDNETGRILEANNAASALYGFEHSELLSMTNQDLSNEPEETNRIMNMLVKGTAKVHTIPYRFHRKKNGVVFPVEISIRSFIKAGRNVHIATVRDITERKRAEEELLKYKDHLLDMVEERTSELEESRETFRALSENTKDVIIRVNNNSQFLYANAALADVFGIQANDYLGKTLPELDFPGNLAKAFQALINKVFLTKQNRQVEFQLPNGNWADVLAIPEFDAEGNVCSIITSARDITELKILQLEIENALEKEKELNQLKDRFISMVSHEYRTPLTSILSSVELLEKGDEKYTKEKKKVHFNRIQKNVDYLINMIDEVLYVNKIDSRRIEVSTQKINLPDFCTEIFDEMKSLYPGIKSTININLKKDYYNIDAAIMKKILGNLISNAYKYNRENGSVDFIIYSETNKIIFKITDSGIGIPEEEQKNVFEPFSRMTNAQNIKGTGLGLSIVQKSVEQMGGTISYISRAGEGTTFTVTIPNNE
jgi:PAS domain S-box-containing protein